MTFATTMAAVIGRPVRHSLSPVMHNAVFQSAGLDWRFERFELVDGGVPAMVASMSVLGIAGLAVTRPHKEAAAHVVDEIDAAAAALSSVNTVVLRDDGTTYGASTDGAGLVNWLTASDVAVDGRSVAVVGAGAAGRSIIDALGRAGAADIAVINRTEATGEAAAQLAAVAHVASHDAVRAADIIVNATSVGMGTNEVPVDVDLLRSGQVVADIVYHPLDTALLRAARARGCAAIDGLGMLVHQAVLQQELWTGRCPDPAVLRSAAEAELARRAATSGG